MVPGLRVECSINRDQGLKARGFKASPLRSLEEIPSARSPKSDTTAENKFKE